MSKSEYSISLISKSECKDLLDKHHYLSSISKGFKSGINYALLKGGEVVGVCIYTGFPVPELVKGMYGLERDDQAGFYELSRLCLTPAVQLKEHNITSWFVSRSLRLLKKHNLVRAVLSYADDEHHKGTIYRACNFKHYGLTDKKKDFWIKNDNGEYTKQSRGKTKGIEGEWRDRSRKRRFVIQFDKTLNIKWKLQ